MSDNDSEFSRKPDINLLVLFAVSTLIVAAGAVVTGCSSPSHSAPPLAASEQSAVPVTLAAVRQVSAARPISAMGRVAHDRDVKLGFKTGGLVQELLVVEGQRVTAGQVVARLDTREIDAAVAQASAGLGKARRDLDRAAGLAQQNVIPGAQKDDAQTATRVASAALANAKFQLATATLTAPVSGVVIKRLAEPGEVVGPGMPVLVIGEDALGAVLVEAGVPAREALHVVVGDAAEVTLDGARAPITATVIELAPTLVPGTDQVLVTLRVPSPVALPRGLVARVSLTPPRGGTLPAVPLAAIVEGEGDAASVYALAPDDAERVVRHAIVIESVRADGLVLVKRGLDGVTQVVDAGTAWLDDGARVRVQALATAESRP